MAEHDNTEVVWEFDDNANALQDISAAVLSVDGFDVARKTDDDWTALGDSAERKGLVAQDVVSDVTLVTKWDTAWWTLFNARGSIRTLKRTLFAGGPTRAIEAGIVSCDPVVENGKKHRIRVQLVNTGDITET
jgi:hypothetical protein